MGDIMISTSAIIAAALFSIGPAYAPSPPDNDDPFTVNYVESDFSPQGGQVVVYGEHDTVIGTVALWSESGTIRISADFDDGYLDAETIGDTTTVEGTLSPSVAGERMRTIMGHLSPTDGLDVTAPPQEGYITCAIGVVATGYSCFAISPMCPLSALAATCSCVPLFEPYRDECW